VQLVAKTTGEQRKRSANQAGASHPKPASHQRKKPASRTSSVPMELDSAQLVEQANPEHPTTISQLGLVCQDLFNVLIDSLRQKATYPTTNGLSCAAIKEELGRFRTWANNIGAIINGTGSLDYRVRDAQYLRSEIKSLLENLHVCLQDGFTHAHKTDCTAILLATGAVEVSYPEPTSDAGSDAGSSESENSNERLYSGAITPNLVLGTYHDEIVDIIDKLFEISIRIRDTAQRFRSSRAATYIEKDEAGVELLPGFKQFIQFKLRRLEIEIPKWLLDRLTDVIVMRRRQFYYQRAHIRRLHWKPSAIVESDPSNCSKQRDPGASSEIATVRTQKSSTSMIQTEPAIAPKRTKSGFSANTCDTIATELMPENEPINRPTHCLRTQTEIAGKNVFPRPPKEPKGKDFICHQCFYSQAAITREEHLWV
jgi:hypothetical protein